MKKMTVEKKKALFKGSIALLILLGIDQLTKYLAYILLKTGGPVVLIPGIFELHYLQNQGAAFGMLENMQWIFILFALAIAGAGGWWYLRLQGQPRFLPLRMVCVTLMAGALGNMIDRLIHHFVIDFLYFSLIDFPIFNVADIYVCISTAVFLFLILFYYKDEDFDRMMGKKTRQEYVSDLVSQIQNSQGKKEGTGK